MATITYQCVCGKSYKLAGDKIGQKVKCPVCGEKKIVGEDGNCEVLIESSDIVTDDSGSGDADAAWDSKPPKPAPRQADTRGEKATGYIKKSLLPNEQVVYTTKLHWIIYLRPLVFLGLGIIMVSAAVLDTENAAWGVIGMTVILIAAFLFVSAFVRRLTSEFGVTTKRILLKTGFIRRQSFEMLLTKVEAIQADQGVLDRLLGSGKIVAVGTGGSSEPFKMIEDPMAFRRAVQEQVDLIGA